MIPAPSDAAVPAIALGFVTYMPETRLLARLEMAHFSGYRVYVFDNSPERPLVRDACRLLSNVYYLTCGRNAGLGYGIASVTAQAYYDSCPALLFFDQDTVFDRSTLDFICEFYAAEPGLAKTHTAVVFNARRVGNGCEDGRLTHRDVPLVISSGSLFYLDNVRQIGWHNPRYFVDCVDYEFCLNSSRHGFHVGECSTTPGFDHETEQADYVASVFGTSRRLRRYPWARVRGTALGSARLLGSAIRSGNGRVAYMLGRFLVGYLWGQVVSRVHRFPAATR